ncbi:EAL domain-containing protein [Cohnella sp.]|uniref:bifunctional diguanylate cyclase/phosphodiesterase n=1 Tax=Cohnella sp. TaxID=1883426 RepID=UPI003569654F
MPIQSGAATNQQYTTPVRIWIILGAITLIIGVFIIWQTNSYQKKLLDEIYRNASIELSANASALTTAIESRLLLSSGLRAFVSTEVSEHHTLSQPQFEAFASNFMQKINGVRNLSVYPKGIATYVYPLKGNEAIVGLNLLTHPDSKIRLNAERTMLTSSVTILGPFELSQGGLGILSRQSIFDGNSFWGFVSVVLDVPSILQEADLNKMSKGIDLAIKANDQVIMGDPKLFDNPKLMDVVALPEGSWVLSALPKQVKLDSVHSKLSVIQIISAISLLLLIYFLYIQLTQKAKLQALVNDRTLNLEIANRQLEATYTELASTEEVLRGQYELLENKEQTVRHMAYHDSVTGLYNRTFFNEQLEKMISKGGQASHQVAVLFLDLDHFKMINDTIGHYYGDVLLNEVGRRLLWTLRNGEIISRIGGDEFTIILPEVTDIDHVRQIAQEVNGLFQQPFLLKDSEHFVTTSIGIALFPDHAHDASTLIMNADMAMYRAKEEGKNQFRFYDSSLNPDAEATMEIKNSLTRALDRGEFLIHYQPQVQVTTEKIIGVEALIRWNHPKRGMVPPCSFIPIAEDTGLIVPIGDWVLRMACAQAKAWQNAGLPPIRIAVNLSARQFMQKNMTERIKQILAETELDPKYLELEITENIAMKDDKLSTLHELRHMGITISIDDFGTQYSSLSYLKRLPVNKVKIDRSFMHGISIDQKDEAIILAMLLIAQRLDLTVIAEGVETNEQLQFLQNHLCDEIQGFLFFKPQPAESVEKLLLKQAAAE